MLPEALASFILPLQVLRNLLALLFFCLFGGFFVSVKTSKFLKV